MQGQTAVVIGATGLIGSEVVQLLLHDTAFTEVRVLVRRPISFSHPKLTVQIVSFDNYHELKEKISAGHSIFCCVGTTQKKVHGDKTAYRKVDFDIPVNSANAAIENGFKKYLLISAIGANHKSNNFYLKLKGEVEEAIIKLPFESIHLFRPSLLIGDRKEFRAGEKIAQVSMQLFSFLFLGPLKKYKPINSSDVAKAMVAASKPQSKGIHGYEYEEMINLSRD
jgi:uncharacterized protein YbjT (DUF2867 family)